MPLTGSLRRSLPQRGTIVTRRPYVRCPGRRVRGSGRTTGVSSPPSRFSGTPHPLPRVLTRPSPLNTSFLQPSTQQITHVYHIPIGTCTGFGSSCNAVGVALETRCHLGQTVKYDATTLLGRSVNVMHNGIAGVIDGCSRCRISTGRGMGSTVAAPETDCVVGVLPGLSMCSQRG